MMKSMLIVALSSVIAAWCGISRYRSRRSTRTTRSMIGMMITNPGPRIPIARPSRNSTRRWYSGTILMALGTTRSRKNTTTARMAMSATFMSLLPFPGPRPCGGQLPLTTWCCRQGLFTWSDPRCGFAGGLDDKPEASHFNDPHRASLGNGRPHRFCAPVLPSGSDATYRVQVVDGHRQLSRHPFDPGDAGEMPGLRHRAHHEPEEQHQSDGNGRQEPGRHPGVRYRCV